MNIQIIEENIEELENSETTFETIQELAYLYIVKNQFQKKSIVEKEVNDILPAYHKYIEEKTKYKKHIIDEEAMLQALKLLMMEISDLFRVLYASSDLRKERIYIEETASNLALKYGK